MPVLGVERTASGILDIVKVKLQKGMLLLDVPSQQVPLSNQPPRQLGATHPVWLPTFPIGHITLVQMLHKSILPECRTYFTPFSI
jgi:hypothetical protein